MKWSPPKLLLLLVAASLLLAASPGLAATVLSPSDMVRVSAHSNPLNIDDSGGIPGAIKLRERQSDSSDPEKHISAFVNFDLSPVPTFDPSRGDTAVFQLDYQGALNNVNNVPMYVGQVTGGPWNSTTNLPTYDWATKSGGPIGPGSQTREKVVVPSVLQSGSPVGAYSADVTDIVDAWQVGSEANYGVGVYIGNHNQGGGFDNPQLSINTVDPATVNGAYSKAVLVDSPLAYYRMNEASAAPAKAADATGNGNDGQHQSQLVLGSPGPRPSDGFAGFGSGNSSPSFNKEANDYVSMPSGFLPTGSAKRTVEGWFYSTDDSHNSQTFFNYGPDSGGSRMTVTASNDSVAVAVSGHNWGKTGLALNPGWHHLSVVLPDGATQSNQWELYVDGGQIPGIGTLAGGTQTISTADTLQRIGRNHGGTTYAGQIDEVAIYGTDLSAAKIRDHYLTALAGDPSRVLLHDHFLNEDPSTGDTGSVNGGFQLVTNGAGGNGSISESGTNISVSATGGGNDNSGAVSINTFDAVAHSGYGFGATWVVTSADDPEANGLNLMLQSQPGFINDSNGRPNLRLQFDRVNDSTFYLVADDGVGSTTDLYSAPVQLTEVLDGFTITGEFSPAGWSFSSIGLPSLADASGIWLGADTYGTLFDSDTHIGAFIQTGGSGDKTLVVDRMTVTALIPEPTTILIWSLLAGLGIGLGWRRRK